MRKVRLSRFGIPFGRIMFEDEAKIILSKCKHSVLGIGMERVSE